MNIKKLEINRKKALLSMLPLTIIVVVAGYIFVENISLLGSDQAWKFHYSMVGFLMLFAILLSAVIFWIFYFRFLTKNLNEP